MVVVVLAAVVVDELPDMQGDRLIWRFSAGEA